LIRVKTQRYIKLINEDLYSKINLKRQYNLNAFKNNELMNIIQSIDYKYYDYIKRFIENWNIDMETEKMYFKV